MHVDDRLPEPQMRRCVHTLSGCQQWLSMLMIYTNKILMILIVILLAVSNYINRFLLHWLSHQSHRKQTGLGGLKWGATRIDKNPTCKENCPVLTPPTEAQGKCSLLRKVAASKQSWTYLSFNCCLQTWANAALCRPFWVQGPYKD